MQNECPDHSTPVMSSGYKKTWQAIPGFLGELSIDSDRLELMSQ